MNLPPVTLQAPMRLTLEAAKSNFVDRKKIIDAIGAAKARAFGKAANYVRQKARWSMKPAPKKASKALRNKTGDEGAVLHAKPGEPPFTVTGLIRQFVLFAYDLQTQTMIIGPVRLSGEGMGDAPSTLEHGGAAIVPVRKKRRDGTFRTIWVKTNLKPRPFMGPALTARDSQAKILSAWKDEVR